MMVFSEETFLSHNRAIFTKHELLLKTQRSKGKTLNNLGLNILKL